MQIISSPKEAPKAYPKTGAFREPPRPQRFTDVVRRIRLFSQESLVTLGTRILWKVFREPEVLEKRDDLWMARNIGALFAERLIALACLCANQHRQPADEDIFVLLCWELHNVVDDDFGSPLETEAVKQRLAAIKNAALRTGLESVAPRALRADAVKARLATFNIARRWEGLADFARPLLIAESFERELAKRCGAHVTKRLSAFLQGSLVDFFRNGFVLNGLLGGGSEIATPKGPVHEFGLAHIVDGPIGDGELAQLGVTGEQLRAFALRLSRTLDSFGELREQLNRIPESERKFSEPMTVFGRWPLIDLVVDGASRRLVAPSPRAFAKSLEQFTLYEMPRALIRDGLEDVRGAKLNINDITAVRGEAYGAYLRSISQAKGVVDADAMNELADSKGKRPDLLWVGDEFGLLIEAKFTLFPTEDRALTNFSAAATAWERAFDALQQTREFAKEHQNVLATKWPAIKKWIPILVVHDQLPEETTRFKAVVHRAGLNADFECLALLSTSEFERWLDGSSPDQLARAAKETWDRVDPDAISDDLALDAPPSGESEHIRAALQRILPGARFEQVAG